jgi:prepilin-type N-terminal cleavage/methylation domain-containing protein
METLLFIRRSRRERGFTLIETMVALSVMTIGLFSVAALMSTTVKTTAQSRYVSVAGMLASEKLEDLDRFKNGDANVAAGGSLGADTAGFFDNVQISSDNGGISETTSSGGTSTAYTQAPGGNITVTTGAGLPAPTPDTLLFNRRWLIVPNTPLNGVRTITVLVTLTNQALKPQVTFEMSLVRP